MSYRIELIFDPENKNRPVVLVHGDGAYQQATTMAIMAPDDVVILPFIESIGKSKTVHLFELDLPTQEQSKSYRFVARTADGFPLGEELFLLVDTTSASSSVNDGVPA